MGYNNAAIPPPTEITGQSSLPLARVKKIIAQDDDISQCSNNAAFVITVATEMFIRYLAEQGHTVAKSEKKPRRNIQYNDVATAVARIDNLDFLSDVVPKTTTWRQHREKKAKESKAAQVEAGQMTLDGKKGLPNGFGGHSYAEDSRDGILNGTPVENGGYGPTFPRPTSSSGVPRTLNGAFADRTTNHGHPNGDVMMSQ